MNERSIEIKILRKLIKSLLRWCVRPHEKQTMRDRQKHKDYERDIEEAESAIRGLL